MQCLQIACGILECFAFGQAGSAAEILITSALNRSAASSKEVRVRVLGSTKKFTNVFPRNDGTFLISRVPTCLNASAVARMKLISSTDNSRKPSRSLRFQRTAAGASPESAVVVDSTILI